MSASPADNTQPAPRPAKKRRWWQWLWFVTPVVLALGVAWVRWYENTPARYQVVGHCTIIMSDKRVPEAWRRESGILLQEGERVFVFHDTKGHERWRINISDAGVSGASPAQSVLFDGCKTNYQIKLSADGCVCAMLVNDATAITVYTWRNGQRLGVAVIPGLCYTCDVACANDGRAYVFREPNDLTYVIRGDQVIAQGTIGGFSQVSADGQTVINSLGDGFYRYGRITIVGNKVTDAGSSSGRYDEQYGHYDAGVPDINLLLTSYMSSQPEYVWLTSGSKLLTTDLTWSVPVAGVAGLFTATVSHKPTHSGWSITLPLDVEAAVATVDDGHLLVCRRMADAYPAPIAMASPPITIPPPSRRSTWPLIRRLFPEKPAPQEPPIALYNRAGNCVAVLPFAEVKRLEGKGRASSDLFIFASSPDGSRLVIYADTDVYFLRANLHTNVWQTITGWFHGKAEGKG